MIRLDMSSLKTKKFVVDPSTKALKDLRVDGLAEFLDLTFHLGSTAASEHAERVQ